MVHAKVVRTFAEPEKPMKKSRKIAVFRDSRHKTAFLARSYLATFACTLVDRARSYKRVLPSIDKLGGLICTY